MSTKYAKTNFKRVYPFIQGMGESDNYRRFEAGECYDPFVVEYTYQEDRHGNPIFSLAHYYEQNGDLMQDPEMEIAVDFQNEEVEPLTYQLDALGVYQTVYKTINGKLYISERLRRELDDFLRQWLKNVLNQQYKLKGERVL